MDENGRRRRWSVAAAAIALLATGAVASTLDQAWPPVGASYHGDKAAPDVSGLWLGQAMGVPGEGAKTNSGQSSDGRPPAYWSPWPLPYTPAYQKIYEDRVAQAKKGHQLGDVGAKCLPFGVPFMLIHKVYPEEIVQTPGRLTMYGWSTFPITIWTDGRGHPRDLVPSYNGHSIGHWVGDTLYVETVGIREDAQFDGMRNPHSDKLRIEWSIQRVAKDILHFHFTMFDAEAFTEPVAFTNIWHRMTTRRWQMVDDSSCFDGTTVNETPQGFTKF